LKNERRRALGVGLSLQGSSMRGTWREGSFTGDPKEYAKALERGVSFHRSPALGKHGGTILS